MRVLPPGGRVWGFRVSGLGREYLTEHYQLAHDKTLCLTIECWPGLPNLASVPFDFLPLYFRTGVGSHKPPISGRFTTLSGQIDFHPVYNQGLKVFRAKSKGTPGWFSRGRPYAPQIHNLNIPPNRGLELFRQKRRWFPARLDRLAVPQSGWLTTIKLTYQVRGTHPSTLGRKRARAHQFGTELETEFNPLTPTPVSTLC